MKTYKQLSESNHSVDVPHPKDNDWQHAVSRSKSICDPHIKTELNNLLLKATDGHFINPNQAIEKVRKVLAGYAIIIPKQAWPAIDGGEFVYEIEQFGSVQGIGIDGKPAADEPKEDLFLYFTYETDKNGQYLCYAEICNHVELSKLTSDNDEPKSDDTDDGYIPLETVDFHGNATGKDKQPKQAPEGEKEDEYQPIKTVDFSEARKRLGQNKHEQDEYQPLETVDFREARKNRK